VSQFATRFPFIKLRVVIPTKDIKCDVRFRVMRVVATRRHPRIAVSRFPLRLPFIQIAGRDDRNVPQAGGEHAGWRTSSGNVWTVPFGGGIGRIMKLGFQPVNLTAQFYGSAA